jgi:prophage regulatory protein
MSAPRIYRFPQLKGAGVPFTRMHIDRLEKRGRFPRRFSYGANSVAWVADEVDAWVHDRIAARAPAKVSEPIASPSNGSGGDVAVFTAYVSAGPTPDDPDGIGISSGLSRRRRADSRPV